MATRQIIEIDQDRCNGCGECATGCPEGALRIIDGKARLVGESLCDGLGACIGNCPLGAIRVTRREADEYNEALVMEGIVPQGEAVLRAHLEHLDHHGQDLYLRLAAAYLQEKGLPIPAGFERFAAARSDTRERQTCPAIPSTTTSPRESGSPFPEKPTAPSALSQWPIQLHLVNPRSGQFAGAQVLLAADCTAFAMASFHADLLAGNRLLIACPKLDTGKDIYVEKLAAIMEQATSFSIVVMEVPCCSGLVKLALDARERSGRQLPLNVVVIGIEGGFVARRSY
jgi:NAD-dependent dihydropyrimidine dehydrogenase PreA subunit